MEKYILCCDWGTSFFRLRLIDTDNYQFIEEVVSDAGIANTFNEWEAYNQADPDTIRAQFFRQQLKKQITILSNNIAICLDGITVLVSGMASSSIGMEEMPYATLPFALNGSGASIKYFEQQDGFRHDMLLISGAKSEKDVMRGEETQLVGLVDLITSSGTIINDAVFIFPGTHSKHIYVQNGQAVNLKTYMTGEIFNLMSKHSILKDSVEPSDITELSGSELEAFKLGIGESGSSDILYSLFTVRTNQLFNKLNKKHNSIYLSGLLIGTELKPLINTDTQLVLCSGSNLHVYYKKAVEELGLEHRTNIISAELIDKAVSWGQIKIYQNQKQQIKHIS